MLSVPSILLLLVAGLPAPRELDASVEQALALEVLQVELESEQVLDSLPAELSKIRSRALEPLFEILCTGGIPAGWRGAGSGSLALDAGRLEAIEDSIAGLAIQHMRVFFREVAEKEERVQFRVQAFELLGTSGSALDQQLMLKLATPLRSEDGILPRNLCKAFERALFDLVVRDRSALGMIERSFPGAHEGLRAALINVVSRLATEESMVSLANMLGLARDQDAYLLMAISRAGRQARHPVGDGVRSRTRDRMRSIDRDVVLCAVRAVGVLEDFESMPFLLELLERGDPSEALAAQRALAELTRLPLQEGGGRWRRWYEAESDWWDAELAPTLDAIRSGGPEAANAAITALASRRLDRHRVAKELLVGLERREEVAVELCCHALGATQSWVAVPALVDALSHEFPSVRRAAHRALQRITGLSLPLDQPIWRLQVAQRT